MKQNTIDGYMAEDLQLPQQALLTAWDCLSRFHGEMVLIGGLAVRHITKPAAPGIPGPVTMDVDFGINIGASSGQYDSIKLTLSMHGFQWEGGRFERPFKGFALYIDLLTDDGKGNIGTVTVDDGLNVSLTPGVNRALECYRALEIEGKNLVGAHQKQIIRVAEFGPLMVLKLNAFAERKAPKDAHDILYLGMNYLDGIENAIAKFQTEKSKGNPGMAKALETLRREFQNADSNGPLSCAAFRLNNSQLSPESKAQSMKIREQCVTLAMDLLRD